jgi:EAL domain-containing protein (putative c-di-GMP-specific phosphodiesterase class I)
VHPQAHRERRHRAVHGLGRARRIRRARQRGGRDRSQLYSPAGQSPSIQAGRISWGERIARALEHDGFTLLAQPVIHFGTGTATPYELLLRMRDDNGGLVAPGAFLDAAERNGLMQQIDCWVAGEAIRMLAACHAGGDLLTLEVNLSPLSIGSPDLLAVVARELERTSVPPASLIFEVTENATVSDGARASQFARDLAGLGCRFALDDFGAGFGSFARLKDLTFEFLKIDGGFVQACRSSETDKLIIKAIVDLAAGMGKRTIAEFVEDHETAHLLTQLGVDYGQGFHLGMPAPLAGAGAPAAA